MQLFMETYKTKHVLHWPSLTAWLLLLSFSLRSLSRVCFRFEEEMRACANQYKLPVPNDRPVGYDFGYGSLNETAEMCRTKGHITVFQCLQRAIDTKCKNTAEERYLSVIWAFTLDTRRSEQAANYICRTHNLQIFMKHKDHCLRREEEKAGVCAQKKNETMPEVVKALRAESSRDAKSNPEAYLAKLQEILSRYECKWIKDKLNCLYDLLQNKCHPDATLLILNYFKETLPPKCVYNYPNNSPWNDNSGKLPTPHRPSRSKPGLYRNHNDVMSDFPQSANIGHLNQMLHSSQQNDYYKQFSNSIHEQKTSSSDRPMHFIVMFWLCFASARQL